MAVHIANPAVDRPARPHARPWRAFVRLDNIPFYGFHLLVIGGIAMMGWSWSGFALAMASYYARMFFITGAYHRYFSHRSYKTSRWFQFLLAVGGSSAAQKGVLWWASHHRDHHRLSDQPGDIHSVRQDGFFWSHVGWIVVNDYDETDMDKIKDFAKYPELVWLNRFHLVPAIALAVIMFVVGGWHALFWGFFVSTVLLWHGTFTINSLSHLFGSRRYETTDDSKNNFLLAMITMGEGWHNNHHYFQGTANQGWRWYEIDLSYYVLRGLSLVGLVWDLKKPPAHVVAGTRKRPKVRLTDEPTAAARLDQAA